MNQINKEYLSICGVELKLTEFYTKAKKIGLNILGIDKYPRTPAFKYDDNDSSNCFLISFKEHLINENR